MISAENDITYSHFHSSENILTKICSLRIKKATNELTVITTVYKSRPTVGRYIRLYINYIYIGYIGLYRYMYIQKTNTAVVATEDFTCMGNILQGRHCGLDISRGSTYWLQLTRVLQAGTHCVFHVV